MQPEKRPCPDHLRETLEAVFRRNSRKWTRFILAILKDESDAEDALQEAVRRVLARNIPFESEDALRMYLARAIGNAALELYNCRKRERLRQLPIHEQFMLPAGTSTPFALLEEQNGIEEKEQLLILLEEGLARLPSKLNEALRLTILDSRGLSIRDAGMTNGIPYSTLRHRTKQGLRKLRRFVQSRSQKQKARTQNSGLRIRELVS